MPSKTYVLGFDTSAAHCAAALLCDGRPVVERHEDMAKGQAERLMLLLEEVLAEAGIAWSDLAAIGVGIGPGNFTGIRISVSAARGLALALGIPAVGVSNFDALAEGVARPVLCLVDARRDQVYAQRIENQHVSAPVLVQFSDIPASLRNGADIVGLGSTQRPQPVATAIARIAARRYPTETKRPAPLYIRAADAAPPRDPAPVILP